MRIRKSVHASSFILTLLLSGVALPSFAQIVPDGGTSTTVTPGFGGRPIVNIAPAMSNGVSHNTYNNFSVGSVGAGLNNTSVHANTIINEVTSTNRSYIEGPVEVMGTRAHVVLANPNGITVNGGTFINTGGVVLSAGSVRFDPFTNNPIVSSGTGDILVGSGGLGGTMTTLQLLAAKIKVDGVILNEHVSPNADISLLAGNSELELDPTVAPSTTLRPFVKSRTDLGGVSNEILVDVTPNGFMSASRVKIAVSSKGAGVNFNGTGISTVGEFSIDASGKISSKGALIRGEGNVRLSGGSVDILNSPERQGQVASNTGSVTVLAGSGDIRLMGQVIGSHNNGLEPLAKGAVTLEAANDIQILSESSERLAIAYGASGDLYVKAGGNITNNSGRLLSNGMIHLSAGKTLTNTMDVVHEVNPALPQVTVRKKKFWMSWLFGKKKRIITTFDYGKLRIPERGLIFGSSVKIDADAVVNQGEISAADGSLIIKAREVRNIGQWVGSITHEKQCGFVCWSKGESDINIVGGVMNAQYGLSIDASDSLINDGGQIVAYGNIEINSPVVTNSAAFVPVIIKRPSGIGNFWTGNKVWIGRQPVGGYIMAPIGTVTITSASPVSNDGGWIEGGEGTLVTFPIEVIRSAQPIGPANGKPIGVLKDWIP